MDRKAIDCMAQHIKTFHAQAADEVVADMKQVSDEVKDYYRGQFDEIEEILDITEYRSRNITNIEDG